MGRLKLLSCPGAYRPGNTLSPFHRAIHLFVRSLIPKSNVPSLRMQSLDPTFLMTSVAAGVRCHALQPRASLWFHTGRVLSGLRTSMAASIWRTLHSETTVDRLIAGAVSTGIRVSRSEERSASMPATTTTATTAPTMIQVSRPRRISATGLTANGGGECPTRTRRRDRRCRACVRSDRWRGRRCPVPEGRHPCSGASSRRRLC